MYIYVYVYIYKYACTSFHTLLSCADFSRDVCRRSCFKFQTPWCPKAVLEGWGQQQTLSLPTTTALTSDVCYTQPRQVNSNRGCWFARSLHIKTRVRTL